MKTTHENCVRNLDERFISKVLPLFKRQSKEVRNLLPELYLHGLVSGDFELALRGLLGEGAPLSAASLQRLKEKWEDEYERWRSEPIEEQDWAYLWTDGIYVKAGIGKGKGGLIGGHWRQERREQAVFGFSGMGTRTASALASRYGKFRIHLEATLQKGLFTLCVGATQVDAASHLG